MLLDTQAAKYSFQAACDMECMRNIQRGQSRSIDINTPLQAHQTKCPMQQQEQQQCSYLSNPLDRRQRRACNMQAGNLHM